jgi:hypothetical protein
MLNPSPVYLTSFLCSFSMSMASTSTYQLFSLPRLLSGNFMELYACSIPLLHCHCLYSQVQPSGKTDEARHNLVSARILTLISTSHLPTTTCPTHCLCSTIPTTITSKLWYLTNSFASFQAPQSWVVGLCINLPPSEDP